MSELCPDKLARLTLMQRYYIAGLAKHGSQKATARALSVAPKTIERAVYDVRKRIGMPKGVRVSMWQEFVRDE